MRQREHDREEHAEEGANVGNIVQEADDHRPEQRKIHIAQPEDDEGQRGEDDVHQRLHRQIIADAAVDIADEFTGLRRAFARHGNFQFVRETVALAEEEHGVNRYHDDDAEQRADRAQHRPQQRGEIDVIDGGGADALPVGALRHAQPGGHAIQQTFQILLIGRRGGDHLLAGADDDARQQQQYADETA